VAGFCKPGKEPNRNAVFCHLLFKFQSALLQNLLYIKSSIVKMVKLLLSIFLRYYGTNYHIVVTMLAILYKYDMHFD